MAKARETTVISPPMTETAADLPDPDFNKHIGDIIVNLSTDGPENSHRSRINLTGDDANGDIMANMEDTQGSQLFRTDPLENNLVTPTTEEADLSGNSPEKKKTKGTAGALRAENRYTKTIAITPTRPATPSYLHQCVYAEAAITLSSDDKPKELIAAIKLLLQNGRYLDPQFGLAPLKAIGGTKPKIITKEDDVPLSFTHLGLYMGTSGRQIFEPRKKWKETHKGRPHGTRRRRT